MKKWRVLFPPRYWLHYWLMPFIFLIIYSITLSQISYDPSHSGSFDLNWINLRFIWIIMFIPIIPWRMIWMQNSMIKEGLMHEQWNFQLPISSRALFLKSFLPIFAWIGCMIYITELQSPPTTDLVIEMNQRTPQHTENNKKIVLHYFPDAQWEPRYTDQPQDPKPYYRPALIIQKGELILKEVSRYLTALIIMTWFFLQYWAIQKIKRQNRLPKILIGIALLFFGFLLLTLTLLSLNFNSKVALPNLDTFNLWIVSRYTDYRWEVFTGFIILIFTLAKYGLHAFKNREMEG